MFTVTTAIVSAAGALLPMAAGDPALIDLTFLVTFFEANVPLILVAIGAVAALGLVIGLTIWGIGKVPGVLKKTAK